MKAITIDSVDELPRVVEALMEYAGGRKKMAFSGEIGAGKTALIQAFCRNLGIPAGEVSSPTYALIHEYAYTGPGGGQCSLYHIDLYRLEEVDEALHIGIEDYLYNEAYCLIEWPELIGPILPEDTVRIKLEIIGDSKRKILFL